jgi:hypothetical protein
VGLEGRMTRLCITLLAAAAAAFLLLPEASFAATPQKQKVQRTNITVHPKSRHWRGYGFLPGYRPQLAESQGTPVYGRPLPRREARYFDYYGNVRYGWGAPGFYRGRYNGGSFGPCWTYTPIGMMPNCGQ